MQIFCNSCQNWILPAKRSLEMAKSPNLYFSQSLSVSVFELENQPDKARDQNVACFGAHRQKKTTIALEMNTS